MNEPRYNIRAVERLTGVPAPTLRSWERRYGFPSPSRTLTARRLYSAGEIDMIRWVKSQTESGLSVGQAMKWVRDGLASPMLVSATPEISDPPPVEPPAAPMLTETTGLARLLLDAVVAYDEPRAEEALSTAFARQPADVVITDVIRPVMVEVGERWARGELSVTHEHFASHLVRRRLFAMLAQQPASAGGPLVVLACVPGEQHEMGLLMLALFLRWAGLHTVYLGADVPVEDLVRCLRETNAAAICLSAISPPSVAPLRQLAQILRTAGATTTIFAGGDAALVAELPSQIHVPRGSLHAVAEQVAAAVRAAG